MQQIPNQDIVQNLEAHLNLLRKSNDPNKDEEFFQLMIKAKQTLGQRARRMAQFYHKYGLYLLSKLEKNMDVLGGTAPKATNEPEEESAEDDQQQDKQNPQKNKGELLKEFKDPDMPEITSDNQNKKQDDVGDDKEEDDDEWQICYQNLEVGLSVLLEYQEKHKNGQVILSTQGIESLQKQICESRIALGDFFLLKQDISKAIEEYEQARTLRSKIPASQKDRMFAEIHYLIGNAYLYQQGKQQKAINYMLKAVQILISHLQFITGTTITQKPTLQKPNVNRLQYLPTMQDNPQSKDLKESILPLLDKLEDLQIEILQRGQFQKVREQDKKLKQQETNPFGFTPQTLPTTTPIISLGTFGSTSAGGNPLIRIKPTATPTHQDTTKGTPFQRQTSPESERKRLKEQKDQKKQ